MGKQRLRTSHILRQIDRYREIVARERQKFVLTSSALIFSTLASFRRIYVTYFFLVGALLNFAFVQVFALFILGVLILKLKSYRLLNRILRLKI